MKTLTEKTIKNLEKRVGQEIVQYEGYLYKLTEHFGWTPMVSVEEATLALIDRYWKN